MKKREAAAAAAKDSDIQEIKRPDGQIGNLQEAMGLEDNKALYMNCRVSVCYFIDYPTHLIAGNRQGRCGVGWTTE